MKIASYGHDLLGTFRQLEKNRNNAYDRTTIPATDGLSASRKLMPAHGLEVSVGNERFCHTISESMRRSHQQLCGGLPTRASD